MMLRTVGYMDLFELVFLFYFRHMLRVELLYHMVVFIYRQIGLLSGFEDYCSGFTA